MGLGIWGVLINMLPSRAIVRRYLMRITLSIEVMALLLISIIVVLSIWAVLRGNGSEFVAAGREGRAHVSLSIGNQWMETNLCADCF